jgi:hypothetical protein
MEKVSECFDFEFCWGARDDSDVFIQRERGARVVKLVVPCLRPAAIATTKRKEKNQKVLPNHISMFGVNVLSHNRTPIINQN